MNDQYGSIPILFTKMVGYIPLCHITNWSFGAIVLLWMSIYYDESNCTLKFHTSSAYTGESLRDCGLLYEVSSKLFENFNKITAKGSNGINNIDDQLIKNLSI